MRAEVSDYWSSLLIAVSGEDWNQVESLLRMDVIDFFRNIKTHEKVQIKKIKQYRKQNEQMKNKKR